VLTEIIGGAGAIAMLGFAWKMITFGRELGKFEERLAQAESRQTQSSADGAACSLDRRRQAEALAGMRSDIDHTRADVARAMSRGG